MRLALCALAVLVACESPKALRSRRGFGLIHSYVATRPMLLDAVTQTLREHQLTIDSIDAAAGEILAQNPSTVWRWGENIAIWVGATDAQGRASVEVVSTQQFGNIPNEPRWDQMVHNALAAKFPNSGPQTNGDQAQQHRDGQ